ncbi:serine/threonine-protein phosphatase [bacterium]|nr:serine/threonine-protein phosphatase [bacterium]
MGFFRRIFGKTDEGTTNDKNVTLETPRVGQNTPDGTTEAATPPPAESEGDVDYVQDDIDPTTKPVAVNPYATPPHDIAEGVTRPLKADQQATATALGREAFDGLGERVTVGQSTHVGKVRNNNQDSLFSFFAASRSVEENPDFGLFVVADGMGGHHDGEKASAIVVRVLASQVTSNIYLPILTRDGDAMPITEAMVNSVQQANSEVIKNVPEGGTTVTAVAIIGDLAHIVHVGDSRAYLMTQDGMEQITRDHSLVQRLIELDQLTREEAERHPQKNVLYRAIGQTSS